MHESFSISTCAFLLSFAFCFILNAAALTYDEDIGLCLKNLFRCRAIGWSVVRFMWWYATQCILPIAQIYKLHTDIYISAYRLRVFVCGPLII